MSEIAARAPVIAEAAESAPLRFTFRGNRLEGRHGWLRLTPAYSVRLVGEVLAQVDASRGPVLDPFCGTGTTLVACAERGIPCTTVELNPFLVWLARAKSARYTERAFDDARSLVDVMCSAATSRAGDRFVPSIHKVERWWDRPVLDALGRASAVIRDGRSAPNKSARDLALVAFCRTLIELANVSFGHQSMSFRKGPAAANREPAGKRVARTLAVALESVIDGASARLTTAKRRVVLGDSRELEPLLAGERFGTVLTSPPYPNRMSYVRELRPYMYWLGYLVERSDAGELDWRAIGGTWGSATSRLATWQSNVATPVPFDGFDRIVRRISEHEPLLGNYVHRYFEDMGRHVAGLSRVVAPGGRLHYVVGNSKFYDVLLPAEEIFAALFEAAGFTDARVTSLRKRTSKSELFEYLVEAALPAHSRRSRRDAHAEGGDAVTP